MKSFAAVKVDPPKKKVSASGNTRTTITVDDTPQNKVIEGSKSSGKYESGAAPRVGGPAKATQGGVPIGGTKKLLVGSRKNVKKSSASPQAKAAARRLYK